jgi:hypothetical protein
MKKSFKTRYEKLEQDVQNALIKKISKSKHNSKHISNCKAIRVNIFDYEELVFINDKLTFLDNDGYHYSLYAECSLEDLIDLHILPF